MGVLKVKEELSKWKEKIISIKVPNYVIVVLAVLIGFLGIRAIATRSNPVYRTLKGISQLAAKDQYEMTIGVQTHLKDKVLDELTEKVQNEVKLTIDKDKEQVQGTYQMIYEGDKVIDFPMIAKEGYVYMDIPKILDKDEYMYFDLGEEYLDKEDWHLAFKYINKLSTKGLNMKPYAKVISEATKGNVESKWNQVTFDLEGKDLIKVISQVLKTAEKDEKLAKYVKKNATKILGQMVKDKFKFGNLDKKLWKDLLENVKDKDFEDNFSDYMKEVTADFKEEATYLQSSWSDLEVEVVVSFDFFNHIKKVVIVPKENRQSIKLTIEAGKGYKPIRKYTTKKGIDMGKMRWEEYMEVVEDTADYLQSYIKKHDDLEEFMEELYEETYYYHDTEEAVIQYGLRLLLDEWYYNFKY